MKKTFILFTLLLFCAQLMAKSYPERLKELITRIEHRTDIDPDSFVVDVKLLEDELQSLSKPPRGVSQSAAKVLKSILHGVLGSAYSEMCYSHISDFDAETKESYVHLSREHFSHVLDDMETLASERSEDYKPLVKLHDGSKYYGHNMLIVMFDFLIEHHRSPEYAEAKAVFQRRGDRNSYTMLRLRELQHDGHYSEASWQKYCQELEALHDSSHDIEAGRFVANALEMETEYVMRSSVYMRFDNNIRVNTPFSFKIESKNTPSVTLQVLEYMGRDSRGNLLTTGKEVMHREYALNTAAELAQARREYMAVSATCSDSLSLGAGRYVFVARTATSMEAEEVRVTSLHHVVFYTPDGQGHAYAVDRITGQPQSGVAVLLYKQVRSDKHDTFVTNKRGEVEFEADKYEYLTMVRDSTTLGTVAEDGTESSYIHYYRPFDEKNSMEGQLFTDRGIYRPGQTVHASALLYRMRGDETQVATNDTVRLALVAPDGEEQLSDPLPTSGMGTLAWDFTLPAKCKLGSYCLMLRDATDGKKRLYYAQSQIISVEEYKRPTYSLEFEKDTVTHQPTDTITALLKAETFAGIPVNGAKVDYRVEVSRQHYWFWRGSGWQTLERADVKTNERGQLTIRFQPSSYREVQDYMQNAYKGEKLIVRITAKATDNAGESHQATVHYLIPLKAASQQDSEQPEVLKVSKTEVQPGENIDIDFTPNDPDAYVFYYVLAGEQVIDQTAQTVNGTLHRRLQCKKSWGDGATVNVLYVKDGHVNHWEKTVNIPKPDKKLKLAWHTFRDRLTPGQQETWTLNVRDKDDKPVSGAQLLATMYDASLDELSTFSWRFSIPFLTQISDLHFTQSYSTSSFHLTLLYQKQIKSILPTDYDQLAGFRGMNRMIGGPVRLMKNGRAEVLMETPLESRVALPEAMMAKTAEASDAVAVSASKQEADETEAAAESPNVNFRTNFNETAFFYPTLTTNAEGQAQITFTLPESLTQWRFMGFVHTDDVRYGLITATAVASKDFMVQPQLPRFLRTADQATIQTRIFNKAEHTIQGTATLRLLLAKDEKTVVFRQDVPFTANQGGTAIATFSIDRGTLTEDVICELSATDGESSDGERCLLPVLSSKELLTENIPFYIDGASTKDIDLTSLYNNNSPTATDRALQIGYTDNPALDVFKSLQALALPQHDNAPCYAAALYSNIVMLSLHSQLSALDNDSLLKQFNADEARQRADEAQSKLRELQRGDGAWSWFKGMEGSAYITMAVAEHLHKLIGYMKRYNVEDQKKIQTMLNMALDYLSQEEQKDYKERKEHKWSMQPTDFDLRYMDICNGTATTLVQSGTEGQMLSTYLTELAKQLNHLTIYGMAKGSCILRKFERRSDANKFTAFLKRYLVQKPGLGRYFATDRAYYSWQDYRIPTQLAAMRCLQAAPSNESQNLHDMQLWLLRQKQVQLWDNPLNGIEVADYLLTISPEQAVRQTDVPTMLLDGKPLSNEHSETLTPQPSTLNDLHTLTVQKHSPGISWGYVRGTFREEADNIHSYSTGELSIERKLYLKQGGEWVELTAEDTTDYTTDYTDSLSGKSVKSVKSVVKIGDILRVRHIIHADRDMDFVSVTSYHASCMESQRTRSGYQWTGTRGCYLELHDTHTDIFFDWFQRGTTTVDLDYYITRSGEYQSGTATTQCQYAPEFGGYTKAYKVKCK
ncbi:MAG: hypothetical protein IJV06_11220 [Bacteroidaceae bacterium]|nr:hypothetical protein [Bacteroidaceae bacterium]